MTDFLLTLDGASGTLADIPMRGTALFGRAAGVTSIAL